MIGKRPKRWRRNNEGSRRCYNRWRPLEWPNTNLLMRLLHVDISAWILMTPLVAYMLWILLVAIIAMVASASPSATTMASLMFIPSNGLRRKSTSLSTMILFIIDIAVVLVLETLIRKRTWIELFVWHHLACFWDLQGRWQCKSAIWWSGVAHATASNTATLHGFLESWR